MAEIKKIIFDRTPWIEKYRPRTIDEIILDKSMAEKIKKIISKREMPNIILTGPPGIGKTTTIRCIIRGLYGKHANNAVLEFNASDDRGIKVVQEPIMNFCKQKLDLNEDNTDDNIYAAHKIIMLDEGDNMTVKAQSLINNLMEKYHKTTRFAFTCNTSSDIIESIQSRCIILRYMRLTDEQIINRLKFICDKENVPHDNESLEALAFISQGDMRYAINNLQRVHTGFGELTVDYIYDVCEKPQPVVIKQIFSCCNTGDFKGALKIVMMLKENGFSESDIVMSMLTIMKMPNVDLKEDTKMQLLKAITNSTFIISKGLDNPLQITACLVNMIRNIPKS